MEWPWKYMVRVTGLGEVQALFLASAHNDEEARQDSRSSDPRVMVLALYRITCLLDEVIDPEVPKLVVGAPKAEPSVYLHTGVIGKPNGVLENLFFECESPTAAVRFTKLRGWFRTRLYQCVEFK